MKMISEITKFDYIVSFRKDSSDEKVIAHSFEEDIYLPEIKYLTFKKNDVIIDVGAHIGCFSLMLNHITMDKLRFFCFEASKETFDILEKNVKKNDLQAFTVVHRAMTSKDNTTIKLYHDEKEGNWGHSVVHDFGSTYEEVSSINLDKFLVNNKIETIKLIKFNCEGAEIDIIMNLSSNGLKKIQNMVLLYHFDLEKNYTLTQIKEKLIKSGFAIDVKPTSDLRGWIIASRDSKIRLRLFNVFLDLKKAHFITKKWLKNLLFKVK